MISQWPDDRAVIVAMTVCVAGGRMTGDRGGASMRWVFVTGGGGVGGAASAIAVRWGAASARLPSIQIPAHIPQEA
jgi:hypothetical protein